MPTEYSPQDATKKIRSLLLKEGGYFEKSRHCREESMPGRDVNDLDLNFLLTRTGIVVGQPEWNDEHQNYVYEIEGTDAVGDYLSGIVTIDERMKEVFVITVY